MKKIVIAFVGLLLMVTIGCSNEEKKEPAETSNETVIQTEDKTAAATKEGAIEGQNKDAGTTAEAVKEPKKKPPIEGC
jgi:uncharacterized lipoprotein NlpE involved in copper resistance